MKAFILLFFFFALLDSPSVWAHRDDYINESFVYETLPKNEFEIEYFLDFHKSKPNSDNFFLNSLAFEYGITNRWMVDGIGTVKTTTHGNNSFDRTRVETRYRFSEEGKQPVDVAVSLEYELENEEKIGHFINPRLVLSKDIIPKLNTTLNVFGELRVSQSFRARAGYALALRYPAEAFFRFGIEFQGLHPDPNEMIIVPQIWFALPHEITFKIGNGISLIGTEEQVFVRGVLEAEF